MNLSSIITCLFFLIDHVSGKLIQAAAGDDVKFALTEECKKGTGTLNHHLMDRTDQLVASLDGVWKPGPSYSNRVNQSGDYLILRSADVSDHGHYSFNCNNKQTEELDELHVFLPSNAVVLQGQDAILPCRSKTAGQRVKSVRWRRNGEVVLELNPQSGQITYGNSFNESRMSIPSDWDRRADMSLTIKRAEVKDGGVFYCDIDKTEKHRSAVRLQVRLPASTPPPGTPSKTTTTPRPSDCPFWSWSTFLITAAVFVIIGLLAGLGWYLRNRNFRGRARPVDEETSRRGEDMQLRTIGICNGDGHVCSVEEDGESDRVQQNLLKSNGTKFFPLTQKDELHTSAGKKVAFIHNHKTSQHRNL